MQYFFGTFLALTITAEAAPKLHWKPAKGFNAAEVEPIFPVPGAYHFGVVPTGTAVMPTGTGVIPWPTAVPTGWSQIMRRASNDSSNQPQTTEAPSPKSPGKLPPSSGTSVLKSAQTIAAGQSFDGGMVSSSSILI
jgi:hypothetical protein